MAIVDDYAGIAAQLRRLQNERASKATTNVPQPGNPPVPARWHPMRATPAGELLYRRLVRSGVL